MRLINVESIATPIASATNVEVLTDDISVEKFYSSALNSMVIIQQTHRVLTKRRLKKVDLGLRRSYFSNILSRNG